MQETTVSSHRQVLLRRFVLLGTPLALGILELGHPLLDYMNPIKMLSPIAGWWIILHMLQIPLFGLMGWALYLLIQDVHSRAATISRYAVGVYIVFAIAYDSAVGLSISILVSNASILPKTQQGIIQQAIQQLLSNPAIVLSNLIVLGAGAVYICSAAWALYHAGAPRLPVFILLGALFAAYSHATPFGPLGNASFFLAALWIELVWRRFPSREENTRAITHVPQT